MKKLFLPSGFLLSLLLVSCSSLTFRYPLTEPISKKSFEQRHESEEIEIFYSNSLVAKTVSSGGSHAAPPYIDSGTDEVARSFPIPGRSRAKPTRPYKKLLKIRTNLIQPAVTPETIEADDDWGEAPPRNIMPTREMVDEGLAQLQEAAAEAGADALTDVFAWVVVEESRFGVMGMYELKITPRGTVLQGIAVRYEE